MSKHVSKPIPKLGILTIPLQGNYPPEAIIGTDTVFSGSYLTIPRSVSICARFYTSISTKMKIGLIWATCWSWMEKMLTAFWKMKREYVLIEICHFFEILFCPQCNVVLNFRNLALVPYYYWHDVFSGETTSAATTVFLNEYSRFVIGTAKQKLNSCGCWSFIYVFISKMKKKS